MIIKSKNSKRFREMLKRALDVRTLNDVSITVDFNPETAQFFFEIGMHCLGCPASRGESIADACAVHGTDADKLVEKLNAFLGN